MTSNHTTWVGRTSTDNVYSCANDLVNERAKFSWLPATALVSSPLAIHIPHLAVAVRAPRHYFPLLLHTADTRRGWTPKMSVPPSETWGWADDDTTCDELLAYVADILTLGEFAGLGREVLHDFAVQVVSAQPQGTDEPEVDSRDTLNYAKIAGYLPMPSRLDKLVR